MNPKFNVGYIAVIKTDELVIVKKWRGLVKILEVQKDRRQGGTYQYLIEDIPPDGVLIKLQGIVNEEDLVNAFITQLKTDKIKI